MEIEDLITPARVMPACGPPARSRRCRNWPSARPKLTGLHERAIFDVLLERERLGSTGVGNGIAIPHGKLAEIQEAASASSRGWTPIDFDAIDDQPVDLVFLLLAPEAAGADHLKALARVSRLLRDQSVCEKLRGADSADAIYALLTEARTSHAA